MNFLHESTRRFTKSGKSLRASSCEFVDESLWRNYADTVARPALRRANVVEETRLYIDWRHHARAGHWREYDDLQCRQRRAVAAIALSEPRSTGDDLGQTAGLRSR